MMFNCKHSLTHTQLADIGKDSHVLTEYLARYGAPCPPDANRKLSTLMFVAHNTNNRTFQLLNGCLRPLVVDRVRELVLRIGRRYVNAI